MATFLRCSDLPEAMANWSLHQMGDAAVQYRVSAQQDGIEMDLAGVNLLTPLLRRRAELAL